MIVSDLTEKDISNIRHILNSGIYILVRENSCNELMPLFKPSAVCTDGIFIISDILGYSEKFQSNFEISICDTLILINSPDCLQSKIYYSLYYLGDLEKSFMDMLERRVLKSVFLQEIDFSDFTDSCTDFIIELYENLKNIQITTEIMQLKTFKLKTGSIDVQLIFNLQNVIEYMNKNQERLQYTLQLQIPAFNLELQADDYSYFFLRLYKELQVRGVSKY